MKKVSAILSGLSVALLAFGAQAVEPAAHSHEDKAAVEMDAKKAPVDKMDAKKAPAKAEEKKVEEKH